MKMSKRAEKALRASIKHWKIDVLGHGERPDSGNCPLCKLYHCSFCSCTNTCPIKRKTKKNMCVKTPFIDHYNIFRTEENTPEMKKQARRMIKFMKALLPEKARK